ncbi:IclR family transcriptional regulator [Leucobacter sp. UT-8R-CII-1-4]|uniref:IclR family transcriptional regulator n=1 Tax=Leucobacter sp. UT-8R-CII-1-4 TaxID=3040075 RepID=UPI0024A88607|nr:IclR family transcriptional regulator [Leucobacter sp. UT-8R-CII-1-4]MDI6022979.1 IclR family transcriptional regulator [Leucobacter sp. UT-8R-CII-1-4]
MTTSSNDQPRVAGSQTLDRGLRALELLSEAAEPLSIASLAQQLGVHRSSAYRVLRTLEEHRFVVRDEAGMIRLGPRLAALGRGAAESLQQAALPELSEIANAFGFTSFIAMLDHDEAVTLLSVEPTHGHATVAQRPGVKHPLTRGAPGYAIESSLNPAEHRTVFAGEPLSEAAAQVRGRGFAISQDEVIPGLTSVAVPLRVINEPPSALAIVCIGLPDNIESLASALREAALRIERAAH